MATSKGREGRRREGRGGEGSVVESKKILKIDPASISLCSPTVLCEIQNYILFNLFFLIGL